MASSHKALLVGSVIFLIYGSGSEGARSKARRDSQRQISRTPGNAEVTSDSSPELPVPKHTVLGNTWAVLVVGGDPVPMTGGHLGHFANICRAYKTLVPRLGDDRIILIGDFDQALMLFQMPVTSEWVQTKRDEFIKQCGSLLHRKPSIYNGPMVNPSTVIRVLRGEKTANVTRVIECNGDCKVLLAIDSHGWHTAPRNLWYLTLPYSTPKAERKRWYGSESDASQLKSGMDFDDAETVLTIPNAGANESSHMGVDYTARGDRYSLLFRGHYVSAFRKLKQDGCSGILSFNVWCASGGFVEFFKDQRLKDENLPLAMMSSTSPYHYSGVSLVKHFWSEVETSLQASDSRTLSQLMHDAGAADNAALDEEETQAAAIMMAIGMPPSPPNVGRSQWMCGTEAVCNMSVAEFFSGQPYRESRMPGKCKGLLSSFIAFKQNKNIELQNQLNDMVSKFAHAFWRNASLDNEHKQLKDESCSVPDVLTDLWIPNITYTTRP